MVDNRSAGFYGIGGGFNFKSGDISGTAAKTSEEKQDQGTEYFDQRRRREEETEQNRFVDRSAQLRASLNSLAVMNAANIRRKKEEEMDEEKREDREEDKKRRQKELLQRENEFKRGE